MNGLETGSLQNVASFKNINQVIVNVNGSLMYFDNIGVPSNNATPAPNNTANIITSGSIGLESNNSFYNNSDDNSNNCIRQFNHPLIKST